MKALPLLCLIFITVRIECSPLKHPGIFCSTDDKRLELELKRKIQGRSGVIDKNRRWKSFDYYINKSVSFWDKYIIRDSIEKIRAILPCVIFKELNETPKKGSYVHIVEDPGCYSTSIGKSSGRQTISLGTGCMNKGTVIHELFHALGVHHEHNRSDRDDYVTIFRENIEPDYNIQYQFDKLSPNIFSDYNVPYNHNSIMHYSSYAFSRNNKPTILTKTGEIIKKTRILQDTDILKIRRMYGCSNEISMDRERRLK